MNDKLFPFHKQPSADSILYRYFTIEKLLDFLLESRISLVRLNNFEDKLEGMTLEHLKLNLLSDEISNKFINEIPSLNFISLNVNPKSRNNLRRKRDMFQNLNYATCWYINNHESVAMWQLYSNPNSVAIRISHEKLVNEIKNSNFKISNSNFNKISYGCIDYYQFNDIEKIYKIDIKKDVAGFIKDLSFAHENEFRIMFEVNEEDKI